LFNALQYAITICLKCGEEVTNPLAQVILIDDDFGIAFEFFFFLLPILRRKFVVFWNHSFLFKEDLTKKNLITC
jgi:hypothetical protein